MVTIAKEKKKTKTKKTKKSTKAESKTSKSSSKKASKESKKKFVVGEHVLVPKHSKLSEKERNELFEEHKITLKELPRISIKDAAISHMELTTDDVIKVERVSPTAKNTVFYRRVVK